MLDDEISMANNNNNNNNTTTASNNSNITSNKTDTTNVRGQRPIDNDPPAPRKMAPTMRSPSTSASSSPVESRVPRPHAATSLAGDVASQERLLSEAVARAKSAQERAERLERDNEQLASTSSSALAEKMAEIDKLKREIKVLKHATTAPADLVASLQNRDDTEAALEKLKSEHEEMITVANAEFVRREREAQLLRQLVLEPAFEGWLAKQGGGNLSRAWKDRFFVLRSGVLSYFQGEDDEKPAGFMHIADATVVKTANTGRDHSFTIQTAKRTYFIAAQNQSQLDAWLGKLGEIIATCAELRKNSSQSQQQQSATTMEQLWRQRQIQKTKDQLAAIATQK